MNAELKTTLQRCGDRIAEAFIPFSGPNGGLQRYWTIRSGDRGRVRAIVFDVLVWVMALIILLAFLITVTFSWGTVLGQKPGAGHISSPAVRHSVSPSTGGDLRLGQSHFGAIRSGIMFYDPGN